MQPISRPFSILFEPWSLGDAVLAARTASRNPEDFGLACHPKWIPLLQKIAPTLRCWIPIELSYTTRNKKGFMAEWRALPSRLSGLETLPRDFLKDILRERRIEVLSIRGDLRDYLCAKKLFGFSTRIRMNGFFSFLARRFQIFDFPVQLGWIKVRNRYQAWNRLCGLSLEMAVLPPSFKSEGPVLIHLGAQWKSKQYPKVKELQSLLEASGLNTRLVAGPGDPLPEGISEQQIERLLDSSLIEAIQSSRAILCNDSGPMHLAACIHSRVLCLSNASQMKEWLPPGVNLITGTRPPLGYFPLPNYLTDRVLPGWAPPESVLKLLREIL